MDKMRQEFEVFAEERGFDPNHYFARSVHPNYYDHDTVNEMWLAWKASRAALRDELKHAVFSEDKYGSGLILSERVFEAIGDHSK